MSWKIVVFQKNKFSKINKNTKQPDTDLKVKKRYVQNPSSDR